ncbi:iron-containing alcohol dehydrogenase [Selenihalanaerobacter shriftii]|uniref:Alcohol dehydrogenase, class IV n=1 Tax=Selenihalanaerobacter shriftii TaxID=142842 RepID=A0A1T4PV76_9FIRM|nr:iron-containing alcohol dehydrogenase [Selenihalanaerobacter shriftii]SJZ95464.1 Alcohol dehydrogenase, class IV [Selenihalanaerobacter shriftii]
MNSFLIPPEIHFEEGALDYLTDIDQQKVVIVTDEGVMEELGFLATAINKLETAGAKVRVIDGVEPNPSVKTVLKGKEVMLNFEPDLVIALGGGSTMDAAKVMWAFYEHPNLEFTDIIEVGSMPQLRNKANFIAIPSTSGTGSEITAFSVITDTEKKIKYPIVSTELIPDVAIIDPDLPATMPPRVTANTGMDVLVHAIEAFVSTNASDYTDALALEAIKIVFEYLPQAYQNGDDMTARAKLHNASAIAGMAFSNASLGIVHSLAHKIGGELDITHGLANAILMPHVIEFNYESAKGKIKEIETALNVDNLADAVRELNKELEIPRSFAKVDWIEFTEADFEEALDRMAANAKKDPCTLTNPNEPTVDDMKEIYQAAFYSQQ